MFVPALSAQELTKQNCCTLTMTQTGHKCKGLGHCIPSVYSGYPEHMWFRITRRMWAWENQGICKAWP